MLTTNHQELYYVACFLSRPEFVPVLYPSTGESDLRKIDNLTARSALSILYTQGSVYASPTALMAALSDLPLEMDGGEVATLIGLIPSKDTVTITDLIEQKRRIEAASNERKLRRELMAAGQSSSAKPFDEVVLHAEHAIRDFRQGNLGTDHSTVGILERMRQGAVATRWRCAEGVDGGQLIDAQAEGIGPSGEFSNGILGAGETAVITAQPGTGKTRLMFNWVVSLLTQGARCDVFVMEDNEASYSTKIMGCKFKLPKWEIERYLVNRPVFLNSYGQEKALRIEEAADWYASVQSQLRIYDGNVTRANLFRFPSAKAHMEEVCAVHGTTHVVVDYVSVWKGEVTTVEGYAQDLRELASRTGVGMLLLAQVSKDTAKWGISPGEVPTKGSGEWGQIAHWGFYLQQDAAVGQQELKIVQSKGRDGGQNLFYAQFDVVTGTVLEYYATPKFGTLDFGEDTPSRGSGKGGRKK